MQNYSNIVEFFRYAAGRSDIIQAFHFGYLDELTAQNMATVGAVKDYPLLLMRPADSNYASIKTGAKVNVSQELYMITKYHFLPDGTIDPLHTKEAYFSEMEVALIDIIRFAFFYSDRFVSSEGFTVQHIQDGENLYVKATVNLFYTQDCDITTIQNPTNYSGFSAGTIDPTTLISIYQ